MGALGSLSVGAFLLMAIETMNDDDDDDDRGPR
jgi:hypothetical protein